MTHSHHKIEMNINEIINVDETEEETKDEIKMSSASSASGESAASTDNRIVSNTIRVTQAPQQAPQKPSQECQICFEKYNKSNHVPIKCRSCDFEACRQCHSTFILDTTNAIPNCMNCHKELPREFMVENFTQKFVTQDWKKHREQIIFQKERALLPTRQPVAEMVRRKDVLKRENDELLRQITELRTRQYQCQREIGNIEYRVRVGPAADAYPRYGGAGTPTPQASTFIRPCPNTANNCRGFLSTQWKCNLCNMWACKDCHEIKGTTQDTPHECNPENLASAKLIDAETRPCPKCGARVFKISGCNQMFCTACNDCAFDWVTGRIETTIHNPHYFEFQRQRNGGQAPRVLGDILCGREVDHATTHTITIDLFPREEISRMIVVWRNANRDIYGDVSVTAKARWDKFYDDCIKNVSRILWATNTTTTPASTTETTIRSNTQKMNSYRRILFRKFQFREICRLIIEIRQVTLPQHRVDPLRYNEELGVKYLLGELTDKDFAAALQRSDKKMQKSRDIQNILTMVLNTSTDIIFRFAEHLRTSRQGIAQNPNYVFNDADFTTMDEVRELFNYANMCLERVSKNYQSTTSLKIGTSLEPNYWEDNGTIIHTLASR